MDSDDSEASEVASEPDAYGEESFIADEIDEDETAAAQPVVLSRGGRTAPVSSVPSVSSAGVRSSPSPGPFSVALSSKRRGSESLDDGGSNPYADDDYEADDDVYSADFEDDPPPLPPTKNKNKTNNKKAHNTSPLHRRSSSSPTRSPPPRAIAEDAEYAYSEASFEEDSQQQQSLSLSTANRLKVDLSVPVRRDSNGSSNGSGGGSSPLGKSHLNPNSPHVDLKVLSKPLAASPPPRGGSGGALRGLAAGLLSPTHPHHHPHHHQHHHNNNNNSHHHHAQAMALMGHESDKSLSLLLRKMESKYQDELEDLREKNALLQWKERELKTQVRIHKEETTMRKSRMDKKKKRALDRRREAELFVDKLRVENDELLAKVASVQLRYDQQLAVNDTLRSAMEQYDADRRAVESRNLLLAEKLQMTLADFHLLNLKYQDAVTLRLDAERKVDELVASHKMECGVIEYKAQLQVESIEKTLAMEREARAAERGTLPESYRTQVANEKERLEKLELQLIQRVREMEAQLAKESTKFDKELALAWEGKRVAEERAERRVHDELAKIARERDALDEQRREVVVAMTKSSARLDDERGKLEATREQLEVKRLQLVEEKAQVDGRAAYLDERVHRLAQEESILEARKAELTKLGRETLDKSRVMAQRMQAFQEMKKELDKMHVEQDQLRARALESEEQTNQLQHDKATLEKTARQLQHERLMVAKQRMQSRQFFDGAKKLEQLLHQQKALDHVSAPARQPTASS